MSFLVNTREFLVSVGYALNPLSESSSTTLSKNSNQDLTCILFMIFCVQCMHLLNKQKDVCMLKNPVHVYESLLLVISLLSSLLECGKFCLISVSMCWLTLMYEIYRLLQFIPRNNVKHELKSQTLSILSLVFLPHEAALIRAGHNLCQTPNLITLVLKKLLH